MVKLVRHSLFLCPTCRASEFRYDHLPLGTEWGPWYCDECGSGFRGEIDAKGRPVVVVDPTLSKRTTFVLLRQIASARGKKVTWFIVRGAVYDGNDIDPEQQRYQYEKHSCPTNFVQCERVILGEDIDPHGMFEWVDTVLAPEGDPDEFTFDMWSTLFPQIRGILSSDMH